MRSPARYSLPVLTLLLSAVLPACSQEPSAARDESDASNASNASDASVVSIDSEHERVSYAIGMNFGRSLSAQEIEPDIDLLVQGLRDGLGDGPALMTEEEIQQTLQAFTDTMRAEIAEEREAQGQHNLQEGEEFLTRNREQPGVEETDSGLQYEILEQGTGPTPDETNQVRVHYEGALLDGTVFDSSYERGEPVVFPVNRVIPGWTEALQMMPVGSKWRLWIPATLAYGGEGAGDRIGPNATLVFEVELLGIV